MEPQQIVLKVLTGSVCPKYPPYSIYATMKIDGSGHPFISASIQWSRDKAAQYYKIVHKGKWAHI